MKHSAAALAVASLALLLVPTAVAASPPEEVDESRLVPALNPDFAPWDCKLKNTGPVCTGEWNLEDAWVPVDLPCQEPLHGSFETHRHSTRFYDHDYLNYDRRVRMHDVDHFSTSPGGPTSATITSHVRFFEPFAVPGDASTTTVVTTGTIWDVGPVGGPSILRVVGTSVEPPGEVGTFTGHVTRDGVTTRYEDAPLDEAMSEDDLFEAVCRATTGG